MQSQWTHKFDLVVSWTEDGPRSRQECLYCQRAWLNGMARERCVKREQRMARGVVRGEAQRDINTDGATVISAACHILGEAVAALELVAEAPAVKELVASSRGALADLEELVGRLANAPPGAPMPDHAMTTSDVTAPSPREVRWHDEPRPRWLSKGRAKGRAKLEGRVVLRRCKVQHGSGHRIGVIVGSVVMDPDATTSERWVWWRQHRGRHNGDSGCAETREAAIAALEAKVAERGWVVRYD